MGMILDTSFIVSAEREARRRSRGPADAFLARHEHETFFITFTIAGELACGRSASVRSDWERLCRPYPILPWTTEIAWRYGEIYRNLADRGQLIDANDMWIAAAALAHGFGVVTDNGDEFDRVPGLITKTF
ncbi:MAG TPA: type II toxin-antitoxin system VapC family toxin [Verrucomicrobiota bacterium]|nr:type II toxin-antitoxin system VapC family toxin [Verrucomicrobiota bacterium]